MKIRAFETFAAFVLAAALTWFGSGLLINLYKTEVGKAAMQLRVNDVIDAEERLWILESIHAELESNHFQPLKVWHMPLIELVNRPDEEFAGLKPGRVALLRRLYEKFHIE